MSKKYEKMFIKTHNILRNTKGMSVMDGINTLRTITTLADGELERLKEDINEKMKANNMLLRDKHKIKDDLFFYKVTTVVLTVVLAITAYVGA